MNKENRPFKVGDRVVADGFGKGVVEHDDGTQTALMVRFDAGVEYWFRRDGKFGEMDPSPTIHHANTGIIEIDTTDVPDLEVDTPIVVWDEREEYSCRAHFAKFQDGAIYAFGDGRTSHTARPDFLNRWKNYRLIDSEGDE